jgi:hypothetical protein
MVFGSDGARNEQKLIEWLIGINAHLKKPYLPTRCFLGYFTKKPKNLENKYPENSKIQKSHGSANKVFRVGINAIGQWSVFGNTIIPFFETCHPLTGFLSRMDVSVNYSTRN